MAKAEQEATQEQATETQAPAEEQDSRQGYHVIKTGSTKHPDAKESEDGRVEAKIGVFLGDSLKEAVEKYGEEFVFDNYVRSVTVAVQGKVRRELDSGVPVSTVEDSLDDLDPTEKQTTVQDPQAQAMRALQKMSPEEKARFRALLEGND